MHLLIVTQYYWPESFRINDIAQALVTRGHQVTVLTGMPNYPQGVRYPGYGIFKPHQENCHGVNILRIPMIARGKRGHKGLLLNYLSFVVSATALGWWRCRGKYDAILVYAPSPITQVLPAIVLKSLKRIPLIFNVQDLWPESVQAVGALKSPRLQRWLESLVRFIYRRCDWILVPSRAFINNVVKHGASAERVEYWPNMADDASTITKVPASTGELNPEDTVRALKLPTGFRVMFAGNIGEAQDFPTLLSAAEQLRENKEIQFVIVGDGRNRAWAESQVIERGLAQSVHFVGQLPYEQMPSLYAQADLLLVTLKSEPIFALTVPSKVQSYLSSAKPIVAALDGEGAALIVEAQAGKVGPAGDATALAANIRLLGAMSLEQRQQLGDNGRSYFLANYTCAKVVDQLEARLNFLTQSKSVVQTTAYGEKAERE